MEPTVITTGGLGLMLTDETAGGQWSAPTVHLFTNDVDPGIGTVKADLTEATFGGYAGQPIASWTPLFPKPDGSVETIAGQLTFVGNGTDNETVYGVYVLSVDTGTPLLAYARLLAPKAMGDADQVLVLTIRLQFGPNGWGIWLADSDE